MKLLVNLIHNEHRILYKQKRKQFHSTSIMIASKYIRRGKNKNYQRSNQSLTN